MGIPKRKVTISPSEVIISLNIPLQEGMSAKELITLTARNRLYISRRKHSGLTPKAWQKAMGITVNVDRNYVAFKTPVSDEALERAKKIYDKVRDIIRRLNKDYEQL